MQLEQYLRLFHASNILILKQDDLYARRRETLKTVFQFLNVDDTFDCAEFDQIMNPSTNRRERNWVTLQMDRLNHIDAIKRIPPNIRIPIGRLFYRPFSKPVVKPKLPDWLQQQLIECLQPDTQRLREYTGWRLEDWLV